MLKRVSLNFAAQVVSLLVSLADRVLVIGILVRAWGPELYADWSVLLSTAATLALGEAGLNIYFGNIWQNAHVRGQSGEFQRHLSVGLTCYLVLTASLVFISAVLIVGLDPVRVLSLHRLDPVSARATLALLAGVVVARTARGALVQLYRGRGEFSRGTMLDSVPSALAVLMVASGAQLGASMLAIAMLYLLAELAGGWLVMLLDIRRRYPDLRLVPALPARTELSGLVGQMRWLLIVQGAPNAWIQLPVIALGALQIAATQIVAFVLLRTLVNFVRQIVQMLSLAAGVELANLLHADNREAALRHTKALGVLSSVLTIVGVVGLYIFVTPLMRIWTGRPELADASTLSWLILAAVLVAPSIPLAAVSMFGGNPRASAIANIAQLVCGLPLALEGARAFGAAGLAAGLASGEIIGQAIVLPMLARSSLGSFDWLSHLGRCALSAAASGAWSLAAGLAVVRIVGTASLLELALSTVLWGVLGAGPALLLGIEPQQRETVGRLARRIGVLI